MWKFVQVMGRMVPKQEHPEVAALSYHHHRQHHQSSFSFMHVQSACKKVLSWAPCCCLVPGITAIVNPFFILEQLLTATAVCFDMTVDDLHHIRSCVLCLFPMSPFALLTSPMVRHNSKFALTYYGLGLQV